MKNLVKCYMGYRMSFDHREDGIELENEEEKLLKLDLNYALKIKNAIENASYIMANLIKDDKIVLLEIGDWRQEVWVRDITVNDPNTRGPITCGVDPVWFAFHLPGGYTLFLYKIFSLDEIQDIWKKIDKSPDMSEYHPRRSRTFGEC